MSSSTILQKVYNAFDPIEFIARSDDARYVDTLSARGSKGMLQQMMMPLLSDEPNTVFFSGAFGDGKTSILHQLRGKLDEHGGATAYGDMATLLDLGNVAYEEVLLAILAIADQAFYPLHEKAMREGVFEEIWLWILRIGYLKMDNLFHSEQDPFGRILQTLRNSPDERLRIRALLRKASEPTLPMMVKRYLTHLKALLPEQHLIIMMDGFEKIPAVKKDGQFLDQRMFLGQATQLSALPCHMLYTIKLELARAHESQLTDLYRGSVVTLPSIAVKDRNGDDNDIGLQVLQDVVDKRMAQVPEATTLADPKALKQLYLDSGGHMRSLLSMIRNACSLAMFEGLPLTQDVLETTLQQAAAKTRLAAKDVRKSLAYIDKMHDLDGITEEERGFLFNQRLVYEYYDGVFWYGISPLVRSS